MLKRFLEETTTKQLHLTVFCQAFPNIFESAGRTARKFRKGCTVLGGNREMTEKYEYCGTVSRTFVQDCSFQTNTATAVLSKTKNYLV